MADWKPPVDSVATKASGWKPPADAVASSPKQSTPPPAQPARVEPAPPMDEKLAAAIYGDAIAVPDAVQLPAPAKVQQRADQGMEFYKREGGEQGMKQRSENLAAMNVADAKASWLDMPRVEQAKKEIETEKLAIKKMEERITQKLDAVSASEQALTQQADAYRELIATRPDMADQLRAEYDQAIERHNRSVEELNEFNKIYSAYQRRVGVDEEAILRREARLNEDVGNPIDLVWSKLVGGAAAVPAALGDMSLGAILDLAENAGIIDADGRKIYEAEFSPRAGKENFVESISDPAAKIAGLEKTTKEYEAKAMDNPFIGTALGLVEQTPALALTFTGNIPAATMVYLAQGYENGMKETSGEEWNDIPPSERRAMAVLNAGIESALESFGASEMVGKTQFTRELAKDILMKMRPGMSPGEITRLINGETSSFFANYAARMLPRMAAEAATEAETPLLQGTTKDIYEWAKSGELGAGAQQLFDNPETADALLDEMKKSALMGAIGAGYIGTIPAISESVSGKKDFADKTPRQFALIEKIVSDPEFVKTWKAEADVAVKQGRAKQADVDKILDDIAVAKKVVDKLPEDLPAEKRGKAASLLLQKEKLSKKERSLVADKIAAIDQQLAALAQTQQATPEATQAATEESAAVAEPVEVTETEQAPAVGVGIRDTAGIERVISEIDPDKQDRVKAVVEGTARTLGVLEQLGDIDVVLHKDGSTMPKGGEFAKGVVTIPKIDKDGNVKSEMHINLSAADQWTGAHETTHLGLRRAFGDNPKLYAHFRDRLQKILKEGDFADIASVAEKGPYTEDQKPEEFLANLVQEMASRLGKGEALMPKERTAIQKIIDLFNEVLRAIGIKPQNLEFKTDQELFDYFNSLAQAIQSDSKVSEEWLNKVGVKRGDFIDVTTPDGVIRSYAGERSNINDEQKKTLALAKQLDRSGSTQSGIRRMTGWFKGREDGKWRYEISDEDIDLKYDGPYRGMHMLSDVIEHDALFEKYPMLREVTISFAPLSDGDVGRWNGYDMNMEVNWSLDKEDILSAVIHETQHAIQDIEGFSSGSSPGAAYFAMFGDDVAGAVRDLLDKASVAKVKKEARADFERAINDTKKALQEYESGAGMKVDIAKAIDSSKPLSWLAYKQTAGEAEAFDAEARMRMSNKERAAEEPALITGERFLHRPNTFGQTVASSVVRSEGGEQKIDPRKVAVHSGPSQIDKLDASKVSGGARAESGWGVYFSMGTKAGDYLGADGKYTYLDTSNLNSIDPYEAEISNEDLDKLNDEWVGAEKDSLVRAYKMSLLNAVKKALESRPKKGYPITFDGVRKEVESSLGPWAPKMWADMMVGLGYDAYSVAGGWEYVVLNLDKASDNIIRGLPGRPNTLYDSARHVYESAVKESGIIRSEGGSQKLDPKRERTYEKLYNDALDYIEQYDVTSKLTLEQVEAEWIAKHARDIDLAKAVISSLNKQLKESQKQILDAANDGFAQGMDRGAAMAEAEGRINLVAAIRDERAQRRVVADAVNAKIKQLGRGKISTAQARLITKAALSVKPGDQASMDKFMQLVDKVMSNMIIANQLAGVEKLQAKAGKRKGGAAESVYVQPFVRIKPYDIPDNLIGDYVQALNELSQRVPKYGTMLRLKDQIAAAKEAGEQSRRHPFDAVQTKQEFDRLAQNMGGVIKTVDEYRQAIRDAAAYQRALIRLFDAGVITQQEYDMLSDQGSKSIDEFNAKNEQEMSALKQAIIADIKALDTDLSKVDFITKERNDLVSKATELNDAELSSLTPVELDDLHQALENAAIDGTVDVAKISDIILSAKLNTYRSEMEQVIDRAERTAGSAKQNAKRKSSVEVKPPSFWANELGFSSKHGNVVDSQVIDPINTAVSDADILRKDTLKAMRDLMKKHGIKSPWDPKRFVRGEKTAVVFDRLGMIVKYMEEYEQGLATDFKDDVGKRDYFADLLSDPGTSNSVTDVGRQDTMDNWRAVWSKLPKKDGKVDVEALYNSVEKNDGKYFPKNEVSFLKEAIAWNNKHLMPKQEFINNWRNQTFTPLGWYMPRVALTKKGDAGIIGETDLVNSVTQGRLTTRSSSSYGRKDNSVKPIETNFIKLMDIHANQVGRDYFVSQAVERSRQALAKMRKLADRSGKQEAKWKVEALSLMLKEKTKQAIEITKQSNADKAVNTALSALTKRLLANPVRIFPEIAAFIPEGAARGQGIKSVASGAKLAKIVGGIQEVDKIMELTGSSVREAGGSAKYLDQRAGEVREENIVSKAVHFISDPVGSLLTKQAWLGVFAREFKNITGETLDLDKLRTSKIYRGTYAKEIEAARSAADNINNRIRTAANAFDKPLKRRTPLGRMDSDSAGAKLFGYLTGYTSRQLDAAMAEFREAIDNAKAGEGSAKDFGSALLTSGMLVGSGMIYSGLRTYLNAAAAYAVLSTLASAADDEEDKKRYEEAAEEALKNLELVQDTDEWFAKAAASLGELAASSAINIGTSGNPAAYRLAIRGLASFAYWKAESDKVDTAGLSGEILKNAQRRNREVDARLAAIAEITRRYTFADPFNVDRSTSLSTSMDLIAGALPVTTAVKFILDDAKNLIQSAKDEREYWDSDTGQQKIKFAAAASVSLFNILGLMKGLALPSVATNKEMQNVRKEREANKEKKMMSAPSADAMLSKAMTEAQKKAAEEAAKNMSILELIIGEETPDNQ